MARGDAKRKRSNRALRAQAEKKHLDPALLLDRGKKSQKKKSNPDNMSASLRKMLQLKAAAEGKPPPSRFQPPPKPNSNLDDVRNKASLEENNLEKIATDGGAEEDQQQIQEQPTRDRKRGPDNVPPPASANQKPSLKARKKNFLNKKKLRKKGKYVSPTEGSDSDEESDPEMRLKRTAAATKPRFAEQVSAPMSINLKRKHWKEDGRTASDRCNEIFAKQMNNAKKKAGAEQSAKKAAEAAERNGVIEAYRKQRKGNTTGATLQSLADLVKKDPVSARLYKYQRGDVVLFRSPTHPNETLIKRIIGLEGDWISIPNSSKIERIPKGACWVEGDNNFKESSSDDSKTEFGPIPLALLKGRAVWICYPFSRWGAVESKLPKGRVLAMSNNRSSSTKNNSDSWW